MNDNQSVSEDARPPILPAHIEDTVQAIARLHAEHHGQATTSQRIVEKLTARAGQPRFLFLLAMLMIAWIAGNLVAMMIGYKPWDEPPFYWLQGATGVAALYMTILILATQRREDQLASHREQLTLELGILSEQKAAKIIQLLEELRRDLPGVTNRVDHEALALSSPADPEAVLNAIKETHDDMSAPSANVAVIEP